MSKLQSDKNEVVLSYYDCILRKADVDLLRGPFWLNDAIIGFYFEYLGQKYQDANCKFLFVSPELTQLLKYEDVKEYPIFLDPLEAKEKDFIFFPLNDCSSRIAAGGTHWSLVVFSKRDKICYYFDSLTYSFNATVARNSSRFIMDYLLGKNNGRFVEMDCPQQTNGYDCGLYVLCFTDDICQLVMNSLEIDSGCAFENLVDSVSKKRESLLNLIKQLKESAD